MISFSEKWHKDVANIYKAYNLFYDRIPDFYDKGFKNQKRIKVEFQAMVYLIEYGLEIALGEGKYPTYQFEYDVYDAMPSSNLLEETIDYITKHPEKIIENLCTLDDGKKKLIKKYGRLLCIKIGNPSSIDTLKWIARYYHTAHEDVGISKYSVMRAENEYMPKGSLQTFIESLESEPCSFSHSNFGIDINLSKNEYFIETNGFIGDGDNEIFPSYEYLKKADTYRTIAIGLSDPFIHYAKMISVYNITWDKEYEQLAEEEKREKANKEKILTLQKELEKSKSN